MSADLARRVERLAGKGESVPDSEARDLLEELLAALESGVVRAAEPVEGGGWRVNGWVKQGILAGFRLAGMSESRLGPGFFFRDKKVFPAREVDDPSIRIVPGGTTVRRGAHLGRNVIVMPPAYVNVGAYLDEGVMVDSHALVGSCAQVGRGVHLSAGVQVGGVLEPVGARPVIVEDGVLVGGQVGLFEGVRVRKGAVLGAGLVLTGTSRLFDLVREREIPGRPDAPLEVPEGAVVVPGTRPARGGYAERHGLALAAPLVVKYRDRRTDARTALEEALR